jgi:hypothetical protein
MECYDDAKTILSGIADFTANEMKYLHKLRDTRTTYASYALNSMVGSLGIIGSTCSEQNHSIILSHLGKHYFASPAKMQADLIHRFKRHQYGRMQKLVKDISKLRLEHRGLEASSSRL